jgi:hypothetical protein
MSPTRLTAATLAAMLTLGALSAIPAGAAPPTGSTALKTSAVTLITGDVVQLTDAGGGK